MHTWRRLMAVVLALVATKKTLVAGAASAAVAQPRRAFGTTSLPARGRRTLAALILAFCLSGAVTASASANFSANYNGIAYGWTDDHAWAIASYSTVASQGAGLVASMICTRVIGEGPFTGNGCNKPVAAAVSASTGGWPNWTNHGIWIAVSPFPHFSIAISPPTPRRRWRS
jgi:hypothetical protein